MKTNAIKEGTVEGAEQGSKTHQLIKLGVDVHWHEYVVVRQIDGSSPQSAQRFSPEGFVAWAARQTQLAEQVWCCYEAGPFGFVLHKQLERLGVRNVVVRPRNWDEYGAKVKTDRRDALALCSSLDRYLAGNTQALAVVRVPTDEQEHSRSQTRQREQLVSERKRCADRFRDKKAPRFAFEKKRRFVVLRAIDCRSVADCLTAFGCT